MRFAENPRSRTAVALLLCAWLLLPSRGATFRRGDANGDGILDIADPVFSLEYIFGVRSAAPTCLDALDANDDGAIDIADPIFSLAYLFLHAEPLPWPFPGPGIDPTRDELGCAAPLARLDFAGMWSGTFIDEEGEYVVAIELAAAGGISIEGDGAIGGEGRAIVAGGLESIGNSIRGGEIFLIDPPNGLYPFGLEYETDVDRVAFLFDLSPDGRLLLGEFTTTSGTSGFGTLARVRRAFSVADAAGAYDATSLDLGGGGIWGGSIGFDAAGRLLPGSRAGGISFLEGSIAIGEAEDVEDGARWGIVEGVLDPDSRHPIIFVGILAADSGIISGWFRDGGRAEGPFLFDPVRGRTQFP